MKTKYLIAYTALIWGSIACKDTDTTPQQALFEVPKNFPKPVYDVSKNPVTQEGFELGKALFYDGQLSRDGSISCGTCHIQASAFTHHGHDLSHGIDDLLGSRNTPAIQNMAWSKDFFWDGGVHDLDLFAIAPIENPVEMDEKLSNVINKLQKTSKYPPLFQKAFGSEQITSSNFLKALAQFQVALVSANSRYDKYVRGEAGGTLSDTEKQGLEIFKQKCATCHEGELFTDNSFRNNGLSIYNDNEINTGRFRITLNEADKYKYKVPSLRNIALSAPYMHDGRMRNLEGVLDHYANEVKNTPNLDPILKQNGRLGIELSAEEKTKIIAFLQTLTDETFTKDRRFAEF